MLELVCRITMLCRHDYRTCAQCLQEDVMVFVNQIGKILHEDVHEVRRCLSVTWTGVERLFVFADAGNR